MPSPSSLRSATSPKGRGKAVEKARHSEPVRRLAWKSVLRARRRGLPLTPPPAAPAVSNTAACRSPARCRAQRCTAPAAALRASAPVPSPPGPASATPRPRCHSRRNAAPTAPGTPAASPRPAAQPPASPARTRKTDRACRQYAPAESPSAPVC